MARRTVAPPHAARSRRRAPRRVPTAQTSVRTCSRKASGERAPLRRRHLREPERHLCLVPCPCARGRLGGQPQRAEDGHDRGAILLIAHDAAAAATGAGEDALQENSLQQRGPVDAGSLRGHDAVAERAARAPSPLRDLSSPPPVFAAAPPARASFALSSPPPLFAARRCRRAHAVRASPSGTTLALHEAPCPNTPESRISGRLSGGTSATGLAAVRGGRAARRACLTCPGSRPRAGRSSPGKRRGNRTWRAARYGCHRTAISRGK